MTVSAPWLPYDKLRPIAERFLGEHCPSREIPIPIEHIVDNRFEIDIVPTPGLHKSFDIDSFITSDFTAIYVDENVYDSRPQRFRFSLAHEVSHVIIHGDVFEKLTFSTITEWKQAVTSIPEKEYGLLEFQANSLAGLILVSPDHLKIFFDESIEKAESVGVTVDDPTDVAAEMIEGFLAKRFDVSTAVINRRVGYDKLWEG